MSHTPSNLVLLIQQRSVGSHADGLPINAEDVREAADAEVGVATVFGVEGPVAGEEVVGVGNVHSPPDGHCNVEVTGNG